VNLLKLSQLLDKGDPLLAVRPRTPVDHAFGFNISSVWTNPAQNTISDAQLVTILKTFSLLGLI